MIRCLIGGQGHSKEGNRRRAPSNRLSVESSAMVYHSLSDGRMSDQPLQVLVQFCPAGSHKLRAVKHLTRRGRAEEGAEMKFHRCVHAFDLHEHMKVKRS